ncbi:hypothetical protein [Actinomadura harenae]|uniref:Integral membrane protein n=1 Tax=Actinomadura harenae TaxID=2483351 RepID=A0A3M2M654_9ACTN|nr:hypothetical protein [Actinomadura harenae]RMI45274.1 hypothetical protein EBO15_10110 [Actinomadura harenae]
MPPTDAAAGAGHPGDGEIEKLRRRVAELEGRPPRHRMRAFGSASLIVVACVLAMLSVISVWASDEITDTGRFVATMGPLAKNRDVQAAVTHRVTTAVEQQIDVNSVVNQLSAAATERGVPPRTATLISTLRGPIGNGLTSLISTVADRVVSSDAFATIWTKVITAAHAAVAKALTGQGGGAVKLNDGKVAVDVGPAVQQVKTQLVDSGFGLASNIPAVHTDFTVFDSPALAKVKTAFRLLQILGNWLPVIALLFAAGGIYLAKDRRKALIGTAIGFAVAMLILGIALVVFRSFFLDQLPADVNSGAAGAVYDALVQFLRQTVRSVGALAVLVGLSAYFTGPSHVATTVRTACSTGIGGIRSVAESAGFRAGPVEEFVRRHKRWIGIGILAVAVVAFLLWNHPTGLVVFWFAVVIGFAFAVREFLAPSPGLASDARPSESGGAAAQAG